MNTKQDAITDAMNARVEAFRDLHTLAHVTLPEAMAMEFLEHCFPYATATEETAMRRCTTRLSEILVGVAPENRSALLSKLEVYRKALQRWEKTLD